MNSLVPRLCATILGLVIITVGVLGFFVTLAPDHLLFGYFQVSTLHNSVHIATGLVGVIAAMPRSRRYPAWYILMVGVTYGTLTFLGFALNGNLFNLIYFNQNDTLLHAGISMLALVLAAIIAASRPEQFIKIPESYA